MDNIKNWIKKYKAEILIILGAIITICTSFAAMDIKYATVSSVIIAVVTVIISVLKEGITENSINLLSNAIYIIIKALREEEIKNNNVLSASADSEKNFSDLTVDDIKEMLVCELKMK